MAPVDELSEIAARSAAQIGAENFPVALRLVPRGPRDALARFYAFARFVDDVGDEATGDRLALLELVDADVRALWTGQASLAPVVGLAALIEQIPQQALLDLIEANRVDQKVTSYETFSDLLGYCALSAAPVGRVVLAIAGVSDPTAVALSDDVCNALQVLEHCQDIAEDARAGRVYLPAADLRAAKVSTRELTEPAASIGLRSVVLTQVHRSLDLLEAGRPLVGSLHGWARLAVSGYVAGGLATAASIRSAHYDTLSSPVTPGKGPTVAHALRLYARR